VTGDHLSRRLAAIVVADVVGYSRMMQDEEARTLGRLRAMLANVVEPVTREFRGRIVKTTGDGWLAEFQSAADAVKSSVKIQRAMARRNSKIDKARRFELRIGINLGEIVYEGGDIFGTGVNVASRLESLANPGGICISKSVYQQVHAILDLRYEDMGAHEIKNIAAPVHTFAVHPQDRGSRRPTTLSPLASGEGRGPSIAVLPFSNLSGDADHGYFVDGVVDGIITALSRFKWLTVIARNSTFAYKGLAVDIRRIAKDLGARYVLEGSVRATGQRVRIHGQLIDASTGAHMWADRFDGSMEDVFDLEDRVTESVVGVLEPQIRRAEIERARRKRPESLEAYDLFLRALPQAYAMRPEDNVTALRFLEEAMRLDPGFVPARAFAAWCYEERLTRGWPNARADDADRAVQLSQEVLTADTDDANVIAPAGFVLVMVGRRYDSGLEALHHAVELNPNNAFVLMLAGWAEAFAGDVTKALGHFERARLLNPRDPAAFYVITGLGFVNFLMGRYEDAAEFAARSAAIYDGWDATYFVLGLALARSGRTDEAHAAVSRLIEMWPGASISHYRRVLPIRDPDRLAALERDMRTAGLPEGPRAGEASR